MLIYFIVKFRLQTHGLTHATMRQDPHEFIINTEWKTATLKNDRKQGPVVPIKTSSTLQGTNPVRDSPCTNKDSPNDALSAQLVKIGRKLQMPVTH